MWRIGMEKDVIWNKRAVLGSKKWEKKEEECPYFQHWVVWNGLVENSLEKLKLKPDVTINRKINKSLYF